MDSRMAFCGAAWAIFAVTLLWTLRRRCGCGFCAASVASLYFLLPPVVHGVLLLVCSSVLVWVASRRCELLPVKNRAVLVTGEARPEPGDGVVGVKLVEMQQQQEGSAGVGQVPALFSAESPSPTPCLVCTKVVILALGRSWRGGSARQGCRCSPGCWMLTELELSS